MNSSLKQIRTAAVAAALAVVAAGTSAHAAEVVVNGEALTPIDRLILTAWNCGTEVPEGRYRLDYTSGAIGFENGPAVGVLPCYPVAAQAEQPSAAPSTETDGEDSSESSSWEDRMCAMGACDVIVNPVY
jgi:hypothetical protein